METKVYPTLNQELQSTFISIRMGRVSLSHRP